MNELLIDYESGPWHLLALRLGHALEPPEDLQVLLERGATRDEPTELRAVAPVPTWRAHA